MATVRIQKHKLKVKLMRMIIMIITMMPMMMVINDK